MELDLSSLGTPQVIVAAIIGVLVLFMGYRIKKVAFFLIWFVLGFYLTTVILPLVNPYLPEAVQDPTYQALLPLAGGLLLALMGFTLERLCVGGISFALVMLITVQCFGTDIQYLAAGGMIAVVVAGIAMIAMKPAIIILTSAVGAYTVTMAVLVLVPEINQQIGYFAGIGGLTAVGAITQFLTTKRLN